MKSQKRNNPDETKSNKNAGENNQFNSGKLEREQKRNQETNKKSNYDDDFEPDTTEKNPATKGAKFDREIQNEQEDDVERNPLKRKPLEEDENEVAKHGKDFEPKLDQDDDKAL